MVIIQTRSTRKPSGGRYKPNKGKKLSELGRDPTFTYIGERRLTKVRGKAASFKNRLLRTNQANVLDQKTKKFQVVEIEDVLENTANRNYVRRDIITKGTIIKTKLGNAKVTSRPAQDGTVNAVIV
jgi:small subunit ribosomal protein S8e